MSEHQIVVVLDIEAPDREAAARCAVGILNGTRGHHTLPEGVIPDTHLESWWFPEADIKHVDRNDNGAFTLVSDDDLPEPPPVGYGCATSGCTGIAYFPSKPGDLCATCRSEADDAASDARQELTG